MPSGIKYRYLFTILSALNTRSVAKFLGSHFEWRQLVKKHDPESRMANEKHVIL